MMRVRLARPLAKICPELTVSTAGLDNRAAGASAVPTGHPGKSVAFDLDSGKKSSRRNRDRARSDAGAYDRPTNQSTVSLPEDRQARHRRHDDRPRSLSPAPSEESSDTVVLPDRFDKNGRPKDDPNGLRREEALEDLLNGRRAGKFFKRMFNG